MVRDLLGQLPKFDALQGLAAAKCLFGLIRAFHLRYQHSGEAVNRPPTLFCRFERAASSGFCDCARHWLEICMIRLRRHGRYMGTCCHWAVHLGWISQREIKRDKLAHLFAQLTSIRYDYSDFALQKSSDSATERSFVNIHAHL